MKGSGSQTRRRSSRQAEMQEQREAKRLRRGSLETDAGILEEESCPVIVSTESISNNSSASDIVEIGKFEVVRVKLEEVQEVNNEEDDKGDLQKVAGALVDMEKACGIFRSYLEKAKAEDKDKQLKVMKEMLEVKTEMLEDLTKQLKSTETQLSFLKKTEAMQNFNNQRLKGELATSKASASDSLKKITTLEATVENKDKEIEKMTKELEESRYKMTVMQERFDEQLSKLKIKKDVVIQDLKGQLKVHTTEAQLVKNSYNGLVEHGYKMSAELESLRSQLKSQGRGMEVLRSDNQRLTQTLRVNNLEIDKLKKILLEGEKSGDFGDLANNLGQAKEHARCCHSVQL